MWFKISNDINENDQSRPITKIDTNDANDIYNLLLVAL